MGFHQVLPSIVLLLERPSLLFVIDFWKVPSPYSSLNLLRFKLLGLILSLLDNEYFLL